MDSQKESIMYLRAGRGNLQYDFVLLNMQTNMQLCDSVNGNTVFTVYLYFIFISHRDPLQK